MRILPDNPSLEFLRREAKDLLAALRESRPSATLADAQRALADQYGLRSWDDLRREVDRRRAEVPVAPDGLADELANAFGVGAPTGAMVAVSYEPMGRTWRLDTDRGSWLAGPVYAWMGHEQAARGEALAEEARARGVTTLVPVPTPSGRLVETVRGEQWRMHEWADLGPIPTQPVSSRVAGRIGEIVGALHESAIPSDAAISPYLTWRRPGDDWLGLVDRARDRRVGWVDDLVALLPVVSALHCVAMPEVSADGTILCNCNLIPDSVRTGRGDDLIVTEWGFAGSLTPELEIGYVLAQWCMRPHLNRAAVAAFADGYARARGAFPSIDRSSFAVAISGWLNWAFNQVCEAIDPADPDKAAFSRREVLDLFKHPLTVASIDEVVDAVAPYAVAPCR